MRRRITAVEVDARFDSPKLRVLSGGEGHVQLVDLEPCDEHGQRRKQNSQPYDRGHYESTSGGHGVSQPCWQLFAATVRTVGERLPGVDEVVILEEIPAQQHRVV